jgi:hypothetical protein
LVFDGHPVSGKDRLDGTLTWYDMRPNGKYVANGSWSAISGSKTLGPIPSGRWTVSNYRERTEKGYVKDGVGFTVDITPDPLWGRSNLRIHPDGPPIGTAGCIGLEGSAQQLQNFSDRVSTYLNSYGTIPLIVTGQQIYIGPVTIRP